MFPTVTIITERKTTVVSQAPSRIQIDVKGGSASVRIINVTAPGSIKITPIKVSPIAVVTVQIPGIPGPAGQTGPIGQTVYVNAAGTPIANINAAFPVLFNQTTNTISLDKIDITDGGNF